MTFKDSQVAFTEALETGRLVLSKPFVPATQQPINCVNDVMYMGTDETGKDLFKHIMTREYIA